MTHKNINVSMAEPESLLARLRRLDREARNSVGAAQVKTGPRPRRYGP